MPITIHCSTCGAAFRVADRMDGKLVKCKTCGSSVRARIEGDDDDDGQPRRRSRQKPARLVLPPWAIYAAAGGVALLIVFGIVYAVTRGQSAPVVAGAGESTRPAGGGSAGGLSAPPGTAGASHTPPAGASGSGRPAGPKPAGTANPGNGGTASGTTTAGSSGPAPAISPIQPPERPPGAPELPEIGPDWPALSTKPKVELAPWTVAVDPQTDVSFTLRQKKLQIDLPAGNDSDVVFPSGSSAFVAVGKTSGGREVREIWDIRTVRLVGTISGGSFFARQFALSPDGRHFAQDNTDDKETGVIVWSVKDGKLLGQLPLTSDRSSVEFLDFAGPNRLVAVARKGPIKVWDVPSGDPKFEIPVNDDWNWLRKTDFAVSPGGKYLVQCVGGTHLHAIDLETGKPAGDLPLPDPQRFGTLQCAGMTFSPDGTELAILFSSRPYRLLCYDVATGKAVASHELSEEFSDKVFWLNADSVRPVEWFPDKRRWLVYGHAIVDRETGGPIFIAEKDPNGSRGPRRMIDGETMLLVVGNGRKYAVVNQRLPEEAIEATAKVLAAGGTQVDVGLPPLTQANVAAAVKLAPEGAFAWTLQPDPVPELKEALVPTIALKGGPGFVQGVYLTQADVAQAVAWYYDSNAAAQRPMRSGAAPRATTKPEAPLWLDRYDLRTGKQLGVVNVWGPFELMNISQDGSLAVTRVVKEEERLDVWKLADGEPLCAFRPYQHDDKFSRKVTAASFAGKSILLTIDGRGTLYAFKIPECKALYRLEDCRNPILSPSGRLLVIQTRSQLRFLDTTTGEAVGSLDNDGRFAAGCFSPDGKRFSAVFHGSETTFVELDLETGRPSQEFAIPRGPRNTMQWLSPRHLLFDNEMVFDSKARTNIWKYELPVGRHGLTSPDGRHWYLAAASQRDSRVTLVGAKLPDEEVVQHLLAEPILDEVAVPQQSNVMIRMNLQAVPPGSSDFASEVHAHFQQELRARGFKPVAQSNITLNITSSQGSTGKSNTYSVTGGDNVTVSETVINCDIWFEVNGKSVWHRQGRISNASAFVVFQQGENLADHLAKGQWESVKGFLLGYKLPSVIFRDTAGMGAGKSQLGPEGSMNHQPN